jgi:hypothetical protein
MRTLYIARSRCAYLFSSQFLRFQGDWTAPAGVAGSRQPEARGGSRANPFATFNTTKHAIEALGIAWSALPTDLDAQLKAIGYN